MSWQECHCGCEGPALYHVKGTEFGKPYQALCCEASMAYLGECAYDFEDEFEAIPLKLSEP